MSTVLNTIALNQHTSSIRSKISYTKPKFNKYRRIHYLIWLLLGTKEKNSLNIGLDCTLSTVCSVPIVLALLHYSGA
jgi:hypothetical protein